MTIYGKAVYGVVAKVAEVAGNTDGINSNKYQVSLNTNRIPDEKKDRKVQ